MKKNLIVVFIMAFIACGYLNAIGANEYFMFERLFSHDFDALSTEKKSYGDKFLSDKDMLDLMVEAFSSGKVDKNSSRVIAELYRFITNIDKRIAVGKCMLGNSDGIDSLGYYSVFDLDDFCYEIVIFDFFREKVYKSEIKIKDGSFTKLVGNIDFVLESDSEGKFPDFIGDYPYGTYSLDLRRDVGRYDCLKFDKPVVDNQKELTKKATESEKSNFYFTNEWKNNCSDYSYCIHITAYIFFTEEEIKYFRKNIAKLILRKAIKEEKKVNQNEAKEKQTIASDDIPVQMKKSNRMETNVEISFMSLNKNSLPKDIEIYFEKKNINYKAYDVWKGRNLKSKNFIIEDVKYHGANLSSVEIKIKAGDGYFTSDAMDAITCEFLTDSDYEIYLSYIKDTYAYSDKDKVFYGKASLSSQFADCVYYDEISCDKQKCQILYEFSVERRHEIDLSDQNLIDYEPFATPREVRSFCGFSDGHYASAIIHDLDGRQYKFHSAAQIEENGKNVLYITLEHFLSRNKITVTADEALKLFLCNERPFGKEKK